jgi:undecaprenyl-diphosphatase
MATAVSLLLIDALLKLASSRRIVPLVVGLGAVAIAGGALGVLKGYG